MNRWSLTKIILILVMISLGSVCVPAQGQDQPTPYPTNTPDNITDMITVQEPTVTEHVSNQRQVDAEASPVHINSFSYQRTSHQLLAVTVEVENVSDTTQHGYVWYLLASPDSSEPWSEAVYVAPEQELTLQPGEQRTFTFDDEPMIEVPGEYRVSVWAHRQSADTAERRHSDGLGAEETLFVGPPFSFSIEYVDLLEKQDATTVYVTFLVSNNTADSSLMALSYSIADPDDVTPWETGVFNLPFKEIVLNPGDPTLITYRSTVALEPASDYQITGWLHQIVNGTQRQVASTLYPSLIGR